MNDATNWIAQAKAWALENYTNGADTLVECWDTSDYQKAWDDCAGVEHDAWDLLKTLCSIWSEQQADARYYREC